MNPYTITQNILHSQWQIQSVPEPTAAQRDWHYVNQMRIEDVETWETVYYQPGVVGVYAAHDPLAEFYAIVPCASCDRRETWRTFWGRAASAEVENWLKNELGIELDSGPAWINLIST